MTTENVTPAPTDGEVFYVQNETEPLTSLGRDPRRPGVHILQRADGSTVRVGGYELRRPGETWDDFLAAPDQDDPTTK